jgi:hypothetical protein
MELHSFRDLEEVPVLLCVVCLAQAPEVSHLCSSGGLIAAAATFEWRNPCASAELWHVRMAVPASAWTFPHERELVRLHFGPHLHALKYLARSYSGGFGLPMVSVIPRLLVWKTGACLVYSQLGHYLCRPPAALLEQTRLPESRASTGVVRLERLLLITEQVWAANQLIELRQE